MSDFFNRTNFTEISSFFPPELEPSVSNYNDYIFPNPEPLERNLLNRPQYNFIGGNAVDFLYFISGGRRRGGGASSYNSFYKKGSFYNFVRFINTLLYTEAYKYNVVLGYDLINDIKGNSNIYIGTNLDFQSLKTNNTISIGFGLEPEDDTTLIRPNKDKGTLKIVPPKEEKEKYTWIQNKNSYVTHSGITENLTNVSLTGSQITANIFRLSASINATNTILSSTNIFTDFSNISTTKCNVYSNTTDMLFNTSNFNISSGVVHLTSYDVYITGRPTQNSSFNNLNGYDLYIEGSKITFLSASSMSLSSTDIFLDRTKITTNKNTVITTNENSVITTGKQSSINTGEGSFFTTGKSSSITLDEGVIVNLSKDASYSLGVNSILFTSDASSTTLGEGSTILTGKNSTITTGEGSSINTGKNSTITTGEGSSINTGKDSSITTGANAGITVAANTSVNISNTLTVASDGDLTVGNLILDNSLQGFSNGMSYNNRLKVTIGNQTFYILLHQ